MSGQVNIFRDFFQFDRHGVLLGHFTAAILELPVCGKETQGVQLLSAGDNSLQCGYVILEYLATGAGD